MTTDMPNKLDIISLDSLLHHVHWLPRLEMGTLILPPSPPHLVQSGRSASPRREAQRHAPLAVAAECGLPGQSSALDPLSWA